MNKFLSILIAVAIGLGIAGICNLSSRSKSFVSFQKSVSRNHPEWPQKKWKRLFTRKKDWAVIKHNYDAYISRGKHSENPKIPKIIHQIWLGSPFPEKYLAFQRSWIKHHPDWEYRLWTDKSLNHFELHNQSLFDSAVNWGEKSDILRYEILYQFGGVYVDTDFECLKSLEPFHHLVDFYTGLFNLDRKWLFPRLGNGIIGACPGHPILKACIENLSGEGERSDCDRIQERTGPVFFTQMFLMHLHEGGFKNAALPFPYFYPLPAEQREIDDHRAYIYPETFALHHWEASWVKKHQN